MGSLRRGNRGRVEGTKVTMGQRDKARNDVGARLFRDIRYRRQLRPSCNMNFFIRSLCPFVPTSLLLWLSQSISYSTSLLTAVGRFLHGFHQIERSCRR